MIGLSVIGMRLIIRKLDLALGPMGIFLILERGMRSTIKAETSGSGLVTKSMLLNLIGHPSMPYLLYATNLPLETSTFASVLHGLKLAQLGLAHANLKKALRSTSKGQAYSLKTPRPRCYWDIFAAHRSDIFFRS